MARTNKRGAKITRRLLTLVLLQITVIAVIVSARLIYLQKSAPIPAPDYAPQGTEENAEPIGDDDSPALTASPGGGAVSLTYAKEAGISLKEQTVTLLFANPSKSTQDMVLQLVMQGVVVAQSGRLTPGNQVTTLSLAENVGKRLSPGGYDAKFIVLYYDQTSAEKAMVNTEVPITVTVTE